MYIRNSDDNGPQSDLTQDGGTKLFHRNNTR